MKFLIKTILLLLIINCNQEAKSAIYVDGSLYYNGEFAIPSITADDLNITPKVTLGNLIINLGGLTATSDYKNIKVIQDNICKYLDLREIKAQNCIIKDGAKVFIPKIKENNITEKDYIKFVKKNYFQNTILVKSLKSKKSEIMPISKGINEYLKEATNLLTSKKYYIKRATLKGSKKFKYIPLKTNLMANDILIIK